MTRCLDEATLQSYFDGELSEQSMESATLHLASCSTCAAAARELEQELNVLMTALEPEFEVSVPTERLRQRIDAAVLDSRIGKASATEKAGFGAFISSFLNFGAQRTLGFASLVMLLAFVAFYGLVRMGMKPEQPATQTVAGNDAQTAAPANKATENVVAVRTPAAPSSAQQIDVTKSQDVNSSTQSKNTNVVPQRVKFTPKAAPKPASVKLFPGERAYLQTIAKLDSTIKSDKKGMRPSLQVEYERNLAVVDRAIAATRSAAKSNPNNPDAADFMFAAYQSKVDLLNTIADARLGGGRSH